MGCPMFLLCKKLEMPKRILRNWNHSSFDNITYNFKLPNENLDRIQAQTQILDKDDTIKRLELEAQDRLSIALDMEECFWREKYRIKWQLEGEIYTEPTQIANHTMNFFQNIFASSISVLQDLSMVEDYIPRLVDGRMNTLLTMLPSLEEITIDVFSLNNDSALGPYDFGASFFHFYWDIIKQDVS
ncbi:hypothetical protein KIW84_043746 [Lathyrus oleraceus]|uniref:Uncharacterized protein n=1 Tax=Pisum sativum TaxID=3888 RepID=A0A9D4XEL3_PEA|nr:hypothetical protein KIW84_043746 [Pisum sativum]